MQSSGLACSYWYILVRTGTYWYRQEPHTLHFDDALAAFQRLQVSTARLTCSLDIILIKRSFFRRITVWMKIELLQQGLVMLQVARTGMEAQDAHEDILVIGQVGDSLDILNMGMPQKTQAK